MFCFINLIKQIYRNLTEMNIRYGHHDIFYARKISLMFIS